MNRINSRGFIVAIMSIVLSAVLTYIVTGSIKDNEINKKNSEVVTLSKEITELKTRGISTESVDVAEWGVTFPQNYVGGIYYKINETDKRLVSFGSNTLDTICEGLMVTVARGKAADNYDFEPTIETARTFEEEYSKLRDQGSLMAWKIGDYYYIYPAVGPNACTDDVNRDKQWAAYSDILSRVTMMKSK